MLLQPPNLMLRNLELLSEIMVTFEIKVTFGIGVMFGITVKLLYENRLAGFPD